MKRNIKFENAQELKKKHPVAFNAPEPEDLERLQPGDYIKICAYNERFWAEVISVESQKITARVDNLLVTPALRYNDIIKAHMDNVYDILPKLEQRASIVPKEKPVKKLQGKRRRI